MIAAIVTDIEGTTSSLSFVKEVLFPYARKHMADFIAQQQQDAAVKQQLDEVKKITGKALSISEITARLHKWIDQDKKVTPLKALQGLLWEKGYRDGDFKGHVYQDAYDQMTQWQKDGIKLYVYSSGSVYAQKLLFRYSDFGDMTALFAGYFDTTCGHKQETQSYLNIIGEIKQPAGQILFLSDIEEELNAAQQAGMKTRWLVRDAEVDTIALHQQVKDFNEIKL
ncbi:MAG: acireductone synthase [Gammaproteobacteria bacterium]|nr:acireductone synthase [Gammaproteobacteria bacterium]